MSEHTSSELVSSSVTAKETVEALMADKEVAAVIVAVNTFKMPALIHADSLSARLKAWGKVGNSWQIEGVTLAIQCLAHFHTSGDASGATEMVREAPLSIRK